MQKYHFSEDNETNDYSEKYAPKSIDDIIGHEKQKRQFYKWVTSYEKNRDVYLKLKSEEDGKRKKNVTPKIDNTSCVYVNGDNGCGKTSFVLGILRGCGYTIYTPSSLASIKSKEAHDHVRSLLNFKEFSINNFINYTDGINDEKIVLVVDEVESMSGKNDKTLIEEFITQNNNNWYFPIVFISDTSHSKIITILKKNCYNICLYRPHDDDMFDLIEKIYIKEDIRMSCEEVPNKLIEHCTYDYRRLVTTLQLVKEYFGICVITPELLDEFLEFSGQRDMKGTIYENTAKLFSKNMEINDSLRIYIEDKNNMPLMVQQNCYNVLNKYSKLPNNKKLIVADKISRNTLHADIIDNCVFATQAWDLRDYQGLLSCSYSNYHISRSINGKKYYEDCERNNFRKTKVYNDYPKDLNKTSTLCINDKTIKATNEYFPQGMSAYDYNYAKLMIEQHINAGRIEECKEMLDVYDLSDTQVTNIFKIDKILKTKAEIPANIKKNIKNITQRRK